MKIFLIRHGESEWNSLHKIQGSCNPGLSTTGIRQAELTAGRCKDYAIAAVYTSPLTRARETAAILTRSRKSEPRVASTLAECNFGELEGKTYSEAETLYPDFMLKWKTDPESLKVKNFEPLQSFRKRVVDIFKQIIDQTPEQHSIALVTHGGVISVLLCYVLDANPKSMLRLICSNASLNLLEVKPGWIEVKSFNDTRHLEGTGS